MALVFRRAEAAETAAVYSLFKKRIRWMDEKGIRQWNANNYLSIYPLEYFARQQELGQLYVVAEDGAAGADRDMADGAAVGAAAAVGVLRAAAVLLEEDERWPDRPDSPAFYVHNLVSDPEAPGAGSFLITETERLASAQGMDFVRLDCAKNNAFLNDYYGSRGYVFAGSFTEGPYVGNRREKKLSADPPEKE